MLRTNTLLCIGTFLFCALVQAQILPQPFACDSKCALPITWDVPVTACGQDNNNYVTALCNSTLASNLQCLLKNIGRPIPNIGVSYPGPCGCPNNCVSGMNRGQCTSSGCSCASGWTADCSLVTSDNTCNGRGQVENILGFDTCVCNGDYALNDCSASVGPLPAITQTIEPVVQYSDWDEYGNDNPIFDDSTIAQLHLTMPQEVLDYMQNPDNRNTDTYFPTTMWFYNGVISETLEKVGFRIKGGASRGYVKKSFKLSFNEFENGRKWYQQKKLVLKAMQQDPSILKEKLCSSLLYSLNAPTQRMAFTHLFINNQFMGVYLLLENIDDQYLKSRTGNDNGALYKCVGDLAYLGPDPELYRNVTAFGTTVAYDPQTPLAETEGYTYLRDLTYAINVTSSDEFVVLLQEILDVDLYLRTLAFEVLTGNWDGLWNGNNYYLYFNPQLAKFQYLRHDLEMSFGMWETLYPMSTPNVYTWGDGGRGYRLINRVLATDPFKSQFTQYCYDLINAYFNLEGAFVERMMFLNNETQAAVHPDLWRQTDFGWSFDEFRDFPEKGVYHTTGGFWPAAGYPEIGSLGLKEFMVVRIESAQQQLLPPSL